MQDRNLNRLLVREIAPISLTSCDYEANDRGDMFIFTVDLSYRGFNEQVKFTCKADVEHGRLSHLVLSSIQAACTRLKYNNMVAGLSAEACNLIVNRSVRPGKLTTTINRFQREIQENNLGTWTPYADNFKFITSHNWEWIIAACNRRS